MHHPTSELQPPSHPSGVGPDQIIGPLLQSNEGKHFSNSLFSCFPRHPKQKCMHSEILPSRKEVVHTWLLKNNAYRFPDFCWLFHDIGSVHDRGSGGRLQNRAEHGNGSSFPSTVWAEKPEDLAFFYLQVQPVHGFELAIMLVQIKSFNSVLHRLKKCWSGIYFLKFLRSNLFLRISP